MAAIAAFACAALLALAGLYRVADQPGQQTIRYAAVTVLWATCICLIITWS
jgi:hypothetical protein